MSMSAALQLAHAPIIEAVIDIDCDLPGGVDFASLEPGTRERFESTYPNYRRQMMMTHQFRMTVETPLEHERQSAIRAFQFLKSDERQLVQIRNTGFSFNRLAPYSTLDEYLPEIERLWRIFVDLVSPVQVHRIALRYINRILLPTEDGAVHLDEYLRLAPRLADEETLQLEGFVNQYSAVEAKTDHEVSVTMLPESMEGEKLPILFDIEAFHRISADPQAWHEIESTIQSLRRLKNRIFRNTLTEKCLNLFR